MGFIVNQHVRLEPSTPWLRWANLSFNPVRNHIKAELSWRKSLATFFIFRWSPSYLWRSLLASRCGLCWCKFFLVPSWSKWKHDPAYKHAILTLNIATKWTYSWKISQAKLIKQLWQQWCYSETPPGLKKRTQSLRLGNSGLEWTAPGSISAARMHGQSSSSICSSGLPFDPCSSSH